MKTGTNHFESLQAAISYYSYGFTPAQVQEKLDAGEIKLGKPAARAGVAVVLDKREGRYVLIEPEAHEIKRAGNQYQPCPAGSF